MRPGQSASFTRPKETGSPTGPVFQSGIFFGFVPFGVGWEIRFFYARGLISRVSAEKKNCVFLVFFGVFVVFGGVFVLLSIFLRA